MSIERKSQIRLQTAAEQFADRGVKRFSEDQERLLTHAADLSRIQDLDHLPQDTPAELIALIAKHRGAFERFLRYGQRNDSEQINANTRIYVETFQPAVRALKAKIAELGQKNVPEYLGSGSNGSAYRLDIDGVPYAVKFTRYRTQTQFELKSLIKAAGIPHTAQLAAYSFEDGVTVMELLPGRDASTFTPEEDPGYTDADIVQLVETVKTLHAHGLQIDAKPSNFMYDPATGFSVLDFHVDESGAYDLPSQVMDLRVALCARTFPRLEFKDPSYTEKARRQHAEHTRIYLPMLIRFIEILQERFPDLLAAWQDKQEQLRRDPNVSMSPIVDRRYMEPDPQIQPALDRLAEMGF